MDIGEILKWGFIVLNTLGLAYGAYRDRSWIKAYSHVNWLLLLVEAFSLPVVLLFVVWLSGLHPIMWLSWLNFLGQKGTNVNLLGTDVKYVGVVVLIIIMINLPRLAAWEENIFRKGTKNWLDAAGRSVLFGFVHMVIGVPLFGALFLTIAGMFYSLMYFMGGTELSTKAHFQFNFLLLTILLIVSVLGWFV